MAAARAVLIDLVAAIRAAGVTTITGVNIADPADPTTWRYDGGRITAADRATAEAVILAAFAADDQATVSLPGGTTVEVITPASEAVADLLERSHVAHVAYRDAIRAGDPPALATVNLVNAQRHRLSAHALDPDHTDPAWTADAAKYPHDELVAFYAQQLARYGLAVVNDGALSGR